MSKKLLDFMENSFLFRRKYMDRGYSSFQESDIESELNRYRDFCLSEVANTVGDNKQNLSVLAEGFRASSPDDVLIKQCALYVEEMVLDDPVFKLTLPKNDINRAMNSYLGMENLGINRKEIAEAATYMNRKRMAIACDFIKFMPISYLHEPPKEIPMRYSEILFSDILPPEILEYFKKKAEVVPLRRGKKGWYSIDGDELVPCRGINITFESDNPNRAFINMLFQTEFLSSEENNHSFNVIQRLPEEPPDPDTFNNWVIQSVNTAAGNFFGSIQQEIVLANKIGSTYLTYSPFVYNLLLQEFHNEKELKADVLNAVLTLELPILQKVSLEDLLDIRQKEGEAFLNFRVELEKHLRELRLITDYDVLRVQTQNVTHELSEVQVNEITKKIAKVKSGMFADALILVGGLVATIQANGLGMLALIYAIEHGYKTYNEYITQVKENPAFFLWKVKEKSK